MASKILFVCLGNICRSPTAEAVFRAKFEEKGIQAHFDSAGTADYHIGERSDPRSIQHAEARGYSMTHRARQFTAADFEKFDLILVMDQKNFSDVIALAKNPEQRKKVLQVAQFLKQVSYDHIPDPYYGKGADFELVIDLLEETAENYLKGRS